MQDSLLHALRARRAPIRARWEDLLRVERVNTPLANPDTLVFMLDLTLDEIFSALREPHGKHRTAGRPVHADPAAACPCGRNPLLVYFPAGEQALLEALVFIQSEASQVDPVARDEAVAELSGVVRTIALREVEAFCAVCQFRKPKGALAAASPGAEWGCGP